MFFKKIITIGLAATIAAACGDTVNEGDTYITEVANDKDAGAESAPAEDVDGDQTDDMPGERTDAATAPVSDDAGTAAASDADASTETPDDPAPPGVFPEDPEGDAGTDEPTETPDAGTEPVPTPSDDDAGTDPTPTPVVPSICVNKVMYPPHAIANNRAQFDTVHWLGTKQNIFLIGDVNGVGNWFSGTGLPISDTDGDDRPDVGIDVLGAGRDQVRVAIKVGASNQSGSWLILNDCITYLPTESKKPIFLNASDGTYNGAFSTLNGTLAPAGNLVPTTPVPTPTPTPVAGKLTTTFGGPAAKDIVSGSQDQELFRSTFSATANLDVLLTDIVVNVNAAANCAHIDDLKIVDVSSGATVAGPYELSNSNGNATCDLSATIVDVIPMPEAWTTIANASRTLKVTANVAAGFPANGTIKVTLGDGIDLFDANTVKNPGNGLFLSTANGDFIPSVPVAGNTHTVKAPTPVPTPVTAKLTTTFDGPAAKEIAGGSQDVEVYAYTMAANAKLQVRETKLRFVTTGNALNVISDIKLVDKATGTVIAGPLTVTADASAIETGDVTFPEWIDLLSGQSRAFKVTADIANVTANGTLKVTLGNVPASTLFSALKVRNMDDSTFLTSANFAPSTPLAGNTHAIKAPAPVPTPTPTPTPSVCASKIGHAPWSYANNRGQVDALTWLGTSTNVYLFCDAVGDVNWVNGPGVLLTDTDNDNRLDFSLAGNENRTLVRCTVKIGTRTAPGKWLELHNDPCVDQLTAQDRAFIYENLDGTYNGAYNTVGGVTAAGSLPPPPAPTPTPSPSLRILQVFIEDSTRLNADDVMMGCEYLVETDVVDGCERTTDENAADVFIWVDPSTCYNTLGRAYYASPDIEIVVNCIDKYGVDANNVRDPWYLRAVAAHEILHQAGVWRHVPRTCTGAAGEICGLAVMNPSIAKPTLHDLLDTDLKAFKARIDPSIIPEGWDTTSGADDGQNTLQSCALTAD